MDDVAKLISGFRAFRRENFAGNRSRFRDLVRRGQSPGIMIIACSDSRVDPAIVTGAELGDLFVVRNVANLVPPCQGDGHYHGTSAALEYAVRGLGVAHVIIFGHARCGGIRALMESGVESENGESGATDPTEPTDPTESTDFVGSWMEIARSARDEVMRAMPDAGVAKQAAACEKLGVKISLANLMTFPWIASPVAAGDLHLHGWYFDIVEGALCALDPENGEFRPVEDLFPLA